MLINDVFLHIIDNNNIFGFSFINSLHKFDGG